MLRAWVIGASAASFAASLSTCVGADRSGACSSTTTATTGDSAATGAPPEPAGAVGSNGAVGAIVSAPGAISSTGATPSSAGFAACIASDGDAAPIFCCPAFALIATSCASAPASATTLAVSSPGDVSSSERPTPAASADARPKLSQRVAGSRSTFFAVAASSAVGAPSPSGSSTATAEASRSALAAVLARRSSALIASIRPSSSRPVLGLAEGLRASGPRSSSGLPLVGPNDFVSGLGGGIPLRAGRPGGGERVRASSEPSPSPGLQHRRIHAQTSAIARVRRAAPFSRQKHSLERCVAAPTSVSIATSRSRASEEMRAPTMNILRRSCATSSCVTSPSAKTRPIAASISSRLAPHTTARPPTRLRSGMASPSPVSPSTVRM